MGTLNTAEFEQLVSTFKQLLNTKLKPNADILERFAQLNEVINLPSGELLRTLKKFEDDNQAAVDSLIASLAQTNLLGQTAISTSVITTAGQLAISNASLAEKLSISRVVVGDGNGAIVTPNPDQISLVNEIYGGLASNPIIDPNNPTNLYFDLLLPISLVGTIREVGIVSDENVLISVGSVVPVMKQGDESLLVRLVLPLQNVSQVDLFQFQNPLLSHGALNGREQADSHPISAITGLEDSLVKQLEKSLGVNARVYPRLTNQNLKVGDVIPAPEDTADGLPITHVIVDGNAYAMSPLASGLVADLTATGATIGGASVVLMRIPQPDDVNLKSFGYGDAGNTPHQNYAALKRFYTWLKGQTSCGVIVHPPYEVQIDSSASEGVTSFLGDDITQLKSFVFDFNGGKITDLTDVSVGLTQHVLFVVRNASVVKFISGDVEGQMPLPDTTRRGMTLCRAYDCGYAEFNGKAKGILNHLETRDCGIVKIAGDFDTVRYPFLTFRTKVFDVKVNAKNCWRDYFIEGSESGNFHIVSDAPRQHSLIKSYSANMVNENITGYYKARNRPLDTIVTPTGQFGFEIESDEQALFRNIHLTVDIEGNYARSLMMRNFKANASPQTEAKGHVFQNVKISGRIRNLSGVTGNLFLVGGGYYSGDFIQNFSLDGLTISGSFVINLAQIIPAIQSSSKMKWRDFVVTDAYLETHDQGFYSPYLMTENVSFPGKAYSSNEINEFGVLRFTKKYIGNIPSGIPIFATDGTRTLNQVVINYCATVSDTAFNPFAEGRLSGLIVYPTSGNVAEFVVDTQFSRFGTVGVADLYEISNGVFGFRIPQWTTATSGMVQIDAMINYSSYGEEDFSSVPGLIYEPYKVL